MQLTADYFLVTTSPDVLFIPDRTAKCQYEEFFFYSYVKIDVFKHLICLYFHKVLKQDQKKNNHFLSSQLERVTFFSFIFHRFWFLSLSFCLILTFFLFVFCLTFVYLFLFLYFFLPSDFLSFTALPLTLKT